MIAIDLNNFVQGSGELIERVDHGEGEDLLKVWVTVDPPSYWFIGTDDRATYTIIDGVEVPDYNNQWYYIDGEFVPYVPPVGPTGATGGIEP
jgi:hypothetical protein